MSEGFLRAYLATALTGLSREERKKVFSLSDRISQVCKRHRFSLYQPRAHTDPEQHKEKAPREVYLTDRERVATSDLVIALCTQPSHGVGAENEIAGGAAVPVVYLVDKGNSLSKMLSGSLGENRLIEYQDPDDLDQQLSDILAELTLRLEKKREIRARHDGGVLPARLKDLRERSGFTIAQLAAKAGIPHAQIEVLETSDEKVSLPTVNLIRSLAAALSVPAAYLLGESPLPSDLTAYQSIQALKDFAHNKRLSFPVYQELRDEYLQSRHTVGFEPIKTRDTVLTEEGWAERYKRFLDRGNRRNLDLWE